MTKVKCCATTCLNNEKSYCSLPEVDLAFAAAVDLRGTAGTTIFLRCTAIYLPQDAERKKKYDEVADANKPK